MKQPVVVTGGTGYIGAWVVRYLLERNHPVRLTVRDKRKATDLQAIPEIKERVGNLLEVWEADLLQPHSFDEVMRGAGAVIHLASPFKLNVRNAEKNLLQPAVNGTAEVLEAATRAGSVKRIILTSSVAAVFGDNADMQERGLSTYTEGYWNETSSLKHQPYAYSKVMAEKKAWELAAEQKNWQLVVINPGFVMGPALIQGSESESIRFMQNLIGGGMRAGAPDLHFGVVDVRDVALAHVLALENEAADGRHLVVAKTMSVQEMAAVLAEAFPRQLRLPLFQTPKWLASLLGPLAGISSKFVQRNVGFSIAFDNRKSREELKLSYRPVEQTLVEMVRQLRSKS